MLCNICHTWKNLGLKIVIEPLLCNQDIFGNTMFKDGYDRKMVSIKGHVFTQYPVATKKISYRKKCIFQDKTRTIAFNIWEDKGNCTSRYNWKLTWHHWLGYRIYYGISRCWYAYFLFVMSNDYIFYVVSPIMIDYFQELIPNVKGYGTCFVLKYTFFPVWYFFSCNWILGKDMPFNRDHFPIITIFKNRIHRS